MPVVVGTALLGAMSLTTAAVDVEHNRGLRPACVHPIDPSPGQIGQSRATRFASLVNNAVSKRPTCSSKQHDGPTHRGPSITARIAGSCARRSAVVDVFVAGKSAEHGRAKQNPQQVAGVLTTAALRQHRKHKISEAEHVIQFSMGQDAGIRSDTIAMEFQPQAAVEIDPQRAIIQTALKKGIHPRVELSYPRDADPYLGMGEAFLDWLGCRDPARVVIGEWPPDAASYLAVSGSDDARRMS
jgi:hypothetical protein